MWVPICLTLRNIFFSEGWHVCLDFFFKENRKQVKSLGYVKGNVHIISYRANRFKSDGTPQEWEQIAEWCKMEEIRKKRTLNMLSL